MGWLFAFTNDRPLPGQGRTLAALATSPWSQINISNCWTIGGEGAQDVPSPTPTSRPLFSPHWPIGHAFCPHQSFPQGLSTGHTLCVTWGTQCRRDLAPPSSLRWWSGWVGARRCFWRCCTGARIAGCGTTPLPRRTPQNRSRYCQGPGMISYWVFFAAAKMMCFMVCYMKQLFFCNNMNQVPIFSHIYM